MNPPLIAERLAVMRAFHLVNVQRSMNRSAGNNGGAPRRLSEEG